MPEKPREINGPLSPRWTPERPFFDRWVPATARDPLAVPDPPPDLYELTDDDLETCRASGIQVTDGKPNCDEIEQKLVAECDISPGQLPTLTWPTILGLLKRALKLHADDFTPTDQDLAILEALAGAKTTLIQAEIVEAAGYDRSIVTDRLGVLESVGCVRRPHGEQKGYAIADAGRALVPPALAALVGDEGKVTPDTPLVELRGQVETPIKTSGAVTWQEAKRAAELHVKRKGNQFPGRNVLAREVRCSCSTMTKAINNSLFLKARQAEYNQKRKKPREVRLNDSMRDKTQQETESDPRTAMLEDLTEDQARDMDRDERQAKARWLSR